MTHLSDFSYLQRVALEIYMGLFLFYRLWTNERLRCLHPKRIFSGELKSIITVLYILMLLMQGSWDVVSTWIKYSEKFFYNPLTKEIISTPFIAWTPQHQHIAQAMDYVECVNLSMQTSVFFLLQCFWNYLSNSVAKKTFMNSWEFRFYIVWALASVAVFPILQWNFRDDVYMRETAPQFAYSVEVLITAFLGIRSHFRFLRIINISRNMKHGANTIVEKLVYFKDMNAFFTVILFVFGLSLGTLCVDGFTTAKTINSNKFASDLLIANCNTASVLMWIVGISIFHPRGSTDGNEVSSFSRSMTTDVEHNNNNNNTGNRFNGASETGTFNKGQRLSQRITNFIVNKNAGSQQMGSSTINNNSDIYSNNGNSNFMRPMSPVQVDFPSDSAKRVFTPTSHFTSPTTNNSVSVDDPYSNQSISFAMMEPTSKRYNVQPERSGSPFSQQSYSKNSDIGTLSKARTNDIRDPLSSDWLKQSSSDRRI